MNKTILFFHLLNDRSGSPYILSRVIEFVLSSGYKVKLCTSNADGFLSDSNVDKRINNYYRFKKSKITTSIFLLITQLYIFFIALFSKERLVYINTITPFGAALGAWFSRKRIIYHMHEVYVKPNLIHRLALYIMNLTSDEVICVSEYVWKSINVKKKSTIVYNSLDHNFVKKAYDFQKSNLNDIPNILMICSLREYKGVNIFVDLASALPQYQFTLVLNSDLQSIKQYIRGKNTNLSNLHIYPKQNNTSLFYEHSDLLLNLSLVDQWIETFGLTILEGMSYGIPCIGPTMGGPPEIITDDIEGYLVDSRDFNTLKNRIIQLLTNEDLYFTFSENARNKSKNFSDLNMRSKIIEIIERNLRT